MLTSVQWCAANCRLSLVIKYPRKDNQTRCCNNAFYIMVICSKLWGFAYESHKTVIFTPLWYQTHRRKKIKHRVLLKDSGLASGIWMHTQIRKSLPWCFSESGRQEFSQRTTRGGSVVLPTLSNTALGSGHLDSRLALEVNHSLSELPFTHLWTEVAEQDTP